MTTDRAGWRKQYSNEDFACLSLHHGEFGEADSLDEQNEI